MARRELEDRILGAVVGATIGDAIGGAFEGWPAAQMKKRTGTDWIGKMWDYPGGGHPYGVWHKKPPKGTGTDDTRMNHIFLETAAEHGTAVNSHWLAMAYIDRYLHPGRYYPKRHADIARAHLRDFYGVSCGHLGMECPDLPGVPVHVLRERSFGLQFPTLIGLLSLACAGCLYDNKPLEAYKHAYELSYFDVGYAREMCGLQAAAVSMAVGGEQDMKKILRRLDKTDPFLLAEAMFRRGVPSMPKGAGELARDAKDAPDLVLRLSRKLMPLHVFDPIDTMTVCLAANAFAEGDFKHAVLVAVNHRNTDEEGNLVNFRDNDCTGYLAGALAGALAGFKKLPAEWVEPVLVNNKKVYGIDIEANVKAFCKAVHR